MSGEAEKKAKKGKKSGWQRHGEGDKEPKRKITGGRIKPSESKEWTTQ